MNHRPFLEQALILASDCLTREETPVGALLVDRDDQIVAQSSSGAKSDETDRRGSILHAELKLILDHQDLFINQLPFTLYVTLEPCHMCMGAALVSRIARVVWATDDFWGGAMQLYDLGREYLRLRMPEMVRTPYADLQRQGADLWVEHLNRNNHPEYIQRMLRWQVLVEG